MTLRVGTWNVNSLRVRLPHLLAWLAENPIDALALQETKLPDADFPTVELAAHGWHAAFSGQRTYNGVAILARETPADVAAGIPGFDDEQRRVLAATVQGVRVIDVYVPNGQTVGSEKFAYKLRWLVALRDYVAAELARHEQLVLLGDFNVAPEDRDVHDPKAWEGSVHVSRAGAGGARRAHRDGPRGLLPAVRPAREIVLLVGLPDDGLPAQRRSADRPDPRLAGDRAEVQFVSHRQSPPQAGTTVRSRAGGGRV